MHDKSVTILTTLLTCVVGLTASGITYITTSAKVKAEQEASFRQARMAYWAAYADDELSVEMQESLLEFIKASEPSRDMAAWVDGTLNSIGPANLLRGRRVADQRLRG